MECYIIPTRLPMTDAIHLSWCLLLFVQYFGLEVTVRFGVFKPRLDPGLAMIGDRVVRRSGVVLVPPDEATTSQHSYEDYLHRTTVPGYCGGTGLGT